MKLNIVAFINLFVFSILFFKKTEAKLDIKCIGGQTRQISVNDFGNIYSPGYTEGKPYPNSVVCSLVLQSLIGRRIRLTFNHLDIAINPMCQSDKLFIVDYHLFKTVIVGEYCGDTRVNDILSSYNRIALQFQSSPFGSGSGFNITYRVVSQINLCKFGEFQCRNRKCILGKNTRCNGQDDCGDGTDEENCNYPIAAPEECGNPSVQPTTGSDIIDRIVGGREALRGSWPWQVDMQMDRIQPNGHSCGGTLLNAQWFVTAAHCILPFRADIVSRIHLGNHHKYEKDPYEQIRYMKDYFVYGVDKKNFLKTGQFNISHDLALVKLNAPVKMNPHVQVACLPKLNEELKVGQKCFATGWGATRGSKFHDVLKQAEHPIQDASKCSNIFIEFNNKTMICAGRLELLYGLCHGDSGGPLVCKKDGKWYVYGATSFVTKINFIEGLCGIADTPTSFSKISSKIDWIRSVILHNS